VQEELAVAQLVFMSVEVGDALFLDHDIARICNLFAHPPHLQRTQWTPGLPGLSSFRASFFRHQASIKSFVALVRSSRICSIELFGFSGCQLEKVLPAMRQPFSEMVYLLLHCEDDTAPVIPDSLHQRMCPTSAVSRVGAHPISGIAETTLICHPYYRTSSSFRVYFSRVDGHRPLYVDQPRNTFTSIPIPLDLIQTGKANLHLRRHALSSQLLRISGFKGDSDSEYLEDLVATIDASRLNGLDVTFFNQIDFDTPLLAQFLSRTPTFKAPNEASVFFHDSAVSITLLSQTAIYEGLEISNLM
jgi:hypothetical protein